MTKLLDPFTLNGLAMPNRMVMAPMTRTRADDQRVPTDLMRDYYLQRASAGLIITECAAIRPDSASIIHAPGIYSPEQILGWRAITDAVHAAGGRMVLQIWHCGRVSHASLQPDGLAPVAPSAVAASGEIFTPTGRQPYGEPRALVLEEIAPLVDAFGQAAINARDAGFDGVELHGAFGYIVDQFLRDGTNLRTDRYGGSLENRGRFLLEVVDAMIAGWSAERIGVRLSPASRFYGQTDSDPLSTFTYAARELDARAIGYLHVMEPIPTDNAEGTSVQNCTAALRPFFRGTIITNGGYDKVSAETMIEGGGAELVSFGVPFLANPDLPRRFAEDAPLNAPDPSTFYGGGAGGYTDYPPLAKI